VDRAALRQALASLPRRQREVVVLRFFADQALAHGDMTVAGPDEPVDGRPTLLQRLPDKDLWVDTTTYLPVRWRWRQDHSTPFDVEWLPPTPANSHC
jgi:hypothetical protein